MTNLRLIAKKKDRARRIAMRCASIERVPPRWVLHLLRPRYVTVTTAA